MRGGVLNTYPRLVARGRQIHTVAYSKHSFHIVKNYDPSV